MTDESKSVQVAYVIAEDWKLRASGVYTFVRLVMLHWPARYSVTAVTFPVSLRVVVQDCKVGDGTAPKRQASVVLPGTSARLALGYLRMLLREFRFFWSVRRELGSRIVVLNDFGAELRPIACRLLLPFSKLVAIAHTHPNLNAKDSAVRQFVAQLCCWSCSTVVFNSYALKRMWEKKFGRKIRRGVVMHHGMDVPAAFPMPDGYPENIPGVIDVVCVGLFYRWKGQLALIEAWPEVMAGCSVPLRLVLVGDGTCLDEAKERVRELGLDSDVVFCGFQKDGSDFFNGGDIAIHYPVEPEAFGLVLLEAMGRGKPVIAPAHGGATEIVVDGETGYLVQTEDQRLKTEDFSNQTADRGKGETLGSRLLTLDRNADGQIDDSNSLQSSVFSLQSKSKARLSLIEAVCRLAEDAELRKRMGLAGRERVRTEFSVEKMLAGYDAVFNSLVS